MAITILDGGVGAYIALVVTVDPVESFCPGMIMNTMFNAIDALLDEQMTLE